MGKKEYYNNADLFGKFPPAFYLSRKNQQGQQTISTIEGLQEILNSIESSTGIFTGDVSTSHVFYDTSLDSSLAMPNSVGGIDAGTTVADLYGDNLTMILDALLFPAANPTLTSPSASLSINPTTTLYEVAATPTITFTTTFSQGSISPQYTSASPYRSGLPNNYDYTWTGATGPADASSSSLTNAQPIGVTAAVGNQSWFTTVSYDAGVQPYDNKGDPYLSPEPADSTTTNTITIEGVYPLFGTTSSISDPNTQQTLVSMISANNIVFNMVEESGGYKQSFDIPDAWTGAPTSRPLSTIETYNTFTLLWVDTGLGTWTTSGTTHSAINYTRYTYNGINRSNIQIRLVF